MLRPSVRREVVLALLVALAGCGGGREVILACSIDISEVVEFLVLDPAGGAARMLRSEWNGIERVGSSAGTEYRFDVNFPRRAGQAELEYRIDRRTLQANRWFLDDEHEPYLDLEATCRRLEEEPGPPTAGS